MVSGRALLVHIFRLHDDMAIYSCGAASSTGLLLKTTGLKVTAIKIDPYMNIDAGTMRPTEHGRLFLIHMHKSDGFDCVNTIRRGLCLERWRRGRPRPGQLRAVSGRDAL